MTRSEVAAVFAAGFAAGAAVWYRVGEAVARYRRARRDLAATIAGVRGLVSLRWAEAVRALRLVAVGALVAVVGVVSLGKIAGVW